MKNLPSCAPRPCASCPYRQDAPSGLWEQHEYDKLPDYDGEIWEQALAKAVGLFMCHQKDGHLCAGWVAAHGQDNLLALRMHPVDLSVWTYETDVAVFTSGKQARDHGMRDIAKPGPKARRLMAKLAEKGKAK